jgi:phospholipase C
MIRTRRTALLASLALVLVGVAPAVAADHRGVPAVRASSPPCGITSKAPSYRHVVVIMEENHSYGSIVHAAAAPFLNHVIAECGLATSYHSVTHPSLPNYLALTSGASLDSLAPYVGDCSPTRCASLVRSNNVFNELARRGWKSYEESMPRPCDVNDSGNYAARHNPALYFADVRKSCPARDLALGSIRDSPLLHALRSERTAPALAIVTPNLCDDMHSCSVGTGDGWLRMWLTSITHSTVYRHHDTAVFIVWDEGEPEQPAERCARNATDQSCHVALLAVAPSVRRGEKVHTSFSHYSLLKTIEILLKVPQLGGARTAASMVKGFNL